MRPGITVLGVISLLAALHLGCATRIGSRAVTPSTDAIAIRVSGGLEPPVQAAARDCSAGRARYVLDLRTRELTWDFCYTGEHGHRALSSSEMAAVAGALAQLAVIESEHLCSPDASEVVFTTTTAGRATEYRNDECGAAAPVLDDRVVAGVVHLLYQLTGV